MLRLTKAVAKIKCDTEENDEIRVSIKKLAMSASRTHGLIAQTVIALEQNSVVVGSNATHVNFL